jgi:hypothetical protein
MNILNLSSVESSLILFYLKLYNHAPQANLNTTFECECIANTTTLEIVIALYIVN